MRTPSLIPFVCSLLALAGCDAGGGMPVIDAADGRDDSFAAGGAADLWGTAIEEGSPEAEGILRLVNEATYGTLLSEVGLFSNAARGIVGHVDGRDRRRGTRDDDPFDTLGELDAVAWVGPRSLEKLLAFARANGYVQGTCVGRPVAADAPVEERIAARRLLVALENGGAVQLDPTTGEVTGRYATGPNAFGAIYTPDGLRAFVTDKNDGTLVEIDPESDAVLGTLAVGANPQQPAITPDGTRMYIPLSGGAGIAVVDISSNPALLRTIDTGAGSKPHIVSLSPDGSMLWATIQGTGPRVVAIPVTADGEGPTQDFRYDLVPRVIFAVDGGAFYTGHHSTGLHFASLADGTSTTPYLDVNGPSSEPRKQIEGVSADGSGELVAITHEGRRALVVLRAEGDRLSRFYDVSNLSANPYWVTFDPSGSIAYVSIPGSGTVSAYDLSDCSGRPLWVAEVGMGAKRMFAVE